MLESIQRLEQRLDSVRHRLENQFPSDIENPVVLANRLRKVLLRLSLLEKSIIENAQVKQQLIETYGGERNIILSDVSCAVETFNDNKVRELEKTCSSSFKEFCSLVKATENKENVSGKDLLTTRAQLNAALFTSNAATGCVNKLESTDSESEKDDHDEETTREFEDAYQSMQAKQDSRVEINSGAFLALPDSGMSWSFL